MTKPVDVFWLSKPRPENDIVRLRPKTLPLKQRFETVADAARCSELTERRLLGGTAEERHIAAMLADCRAGNYRCENVICPICARKYRRWFAGEALRNVRIERNRRAHVATLHLGSFDKGMLREADLPLLHQRIRARLRRTPGEDVIAIGGIEASLKAEVWIVHLHALLLGADARKLEAIRSKFDGV